MIVGVLVENQTSSILNTSLKHYHFASLLNGNRWHFTNDPIYIQHICMKWASDMSAICSMISNKATETGRKEHYLAFAERW